jgi:hypothetical protein
MHPPANGVTVALTLSMLMVCVATVSAMNRSLPAVRACREGTQPGSADGASTGIQASFCTRPCTPFGSLLV